MSLLDRSQGDLSIMEDGAPLRKGLRPHELTIELYEGLTDLRNYVDAIKTPAGRATLLGLFAISIATWAGLRNVDSVSAKGYGGIKGGHPLDVGDDLGTGDGTAMSSVHPNIQRIEGITPGDLDWQRKHVMISDNVDVNPPIMSEPIFKMTDGAGLPFAENYGLPEVDRVEVTPYGGEGMFGVQEVMDVALATLDANEVALDPTTVSAVTFVNEWSVIRSSSEDRRPRARNLPAENATIVFGFEVGTGDAKAVMQVNERGQAIGFRNQASLQTDKVVILDVLRGEVGTKDADSIGYYSAEGKFIPLINFDGGNLAVSVPVDDNGTIELHEPRVSSRARVMSANDFKRQGDVAPEITTLEAAAPTMTLLNELGVTVGADGIVELKMDGDAVVIIEKSTGEEVGRDGLLTLDFMQEALSRTDLVGGPQEKPNPNASRRNYPYQYGPIPAFSIDLATKFNIEFKEVTGKDRFISGNPKNGRKEKILVGEMSWMNAMGETLDGNPENTMFNYVVFRLKSDPSKIKWYEILPASVKDLERMWDDEG